MSLQNRHHVTRRSLLSRRYHNLRKNQQDSAMCFVERLNAENFEFDVQELATPQHGRRPHSYTVRLNDWWCDCGHFQAL